MKYNTSLLIVSMVLLLFCSCANEEKPVVKSPNIVLILTDDQGWGDLSMNGNKSLSTPNIDKLAAEGVKFERFFVSPVCSPTRAEILTGRFSVRGGVYSTSAGGERLDLDEKLISQYLREAGYATAAYGKWHNGMQAGYHPNARGFDDYYGFCSGHWGNYFDPMLEHNGTIVEGKGFMVDDLINHGIDFIEKNKTNPFFLYLPLNTPHSPMQVPDKYWEKFANDDPAQKGTIAENEKILHTKAALAMCENIDWNVGRIVEKLEADNLMENTIILYLADNGPNGHRWNGGMKGTKGSTDEGGVRSPLVIKWKNNLEAGKKIEQIASSLDLLPTLCDLANIDLQPTNKIDGKSLKPLMKGLDVEWDDRLIYNYWKDKLSVRSQTYRLGNKGQLFDMVKDPNQLKDIAAENPGVYKELSDAKVKWEAEVKIELPEQDERTFDIGHPDLVYTQIPARDATAHGNIIRSNRFPNCTYMTQWKALDDRITWEANVLEGGEYEVDLYYTCPAEDVGSTFTLSFGEASLSNKISVAHDPPETGMEHDRFIRQESYVKDFKKMELGTITLNKGEGVLELKATNILGSQVMDFRLLLFKKVS